MVDILNKNNAVSYRFIQIRFWYPVILYQPWYFDRLGGNSKISNARLTSKQSIASPLFKMSNEVTKQFMNSMLYGTGADTSAFRKVPYLMSLGKAGLRAGTLCWELDLGDGRGED